MIELILKLIDRIIDLKKYRDERFRKTFDDILDPLFKDLEAVHGNYIRMFEGVDAQLAAIPDLESRPGRIRLREIAESLRQQRLEFEPVRVKLAAMNHELGQLIYGTDPKLDNPSVKEFVASVLRYLPRGNVSGRTTRASALVRALQGALAITPEQIDEEGEDLRELVSSTVEECRENWHSVAAAHATLKLALHSHR